ncbi:hypothetical protein L596_026543 [Steinernema carpocapsae]|uniref:Uncharacterized protein n=1 Tax=Steinernema carpocapsae TaxID=34508 RepID=A0A4U5M2N8_STECR|nr:hypothetical protein L596_026543 [Steinernema carpocapsae]
MAAGNGELIQEFSHAFQTTPLVRYSSFVLPIFIPTCTNPLKHKISPKSLPKRPTTVWGMRPITRYRAHFRYDQTRRGNSCHAGLQ